jgi:DNA-binding PadR family transcriptional regulator
VGEPTGERGGRRRKHFEMTPLGERMLGDAYKTYTRMTAGLERRLRTLS